MRVSIISSRKAREKKPNYKPSETGMGERRLEDQKRSELFARIENPERL